MSLRVYSTTFCQLSGISLCVVHLSPASASGQGKRKPSSAAAQLSARLISHVSKQPSGVFRHEHVLLATACETVTEETKPGIDSMCQPHLLAASLACEPPRDVQTSLLV